MWAVYLMLQVPLLKVLTPVAVSFYTMLFALPVTVIVSVIEYIIMGPSSLAALHGDRWLIVWVAILYYGIVSSVLIQNLTLFCMKQTSPTIVSAFVPVQVSYGICACQAQPVVTIVIAVILLADYPGVNQYLGAVLIVLGLWGVLYARSKDQKLSIPSSPQPVEMPAISPKLEEPEVMALTHGDVVIQYREPGNSLMKELAAKQPT